MQSDNRTAGAPGGASEIRNGLVSIMMPAYNAEATIGAAIESVLAQTYSRWELWIVLDGPAPAAEQVVSSYRDPRIHLLRQEHSGEAAARNLALRHLAGEWVAFLDADDLLLPNHLELAAEHLHAHPERGGVYTDGFYIDEDGRRLGLLSSRRRGPFEGRIFEEVVRASDVFGPPMCTVLRREPVLRRELNFDTRIVIGPDWDFLMRFSAGEDFGYLAEPTCLYRLHPNAITRTAEPERRRASLALCREKAIRNPAFPGCSSEVRTAALYDLLVNLLHGLPDRQREVTGWAEFAQLPRGSRARLLRVMASRSVSLGGNRGGEDAWFAEAFRLRPWDPRNAALLVLFRLHPSLCRLALKMRATVSGRGDAPTPARAGV
jgi:glycosyltransferase involved in cell wall biosynthesis